MRLKVKLDIDKDSIDRQIDKIEIEKIVQQKKQLEIERKERNIAYSRVYILSGSDQIRLDQTRIKSDEIY